MVDFVVLLLQIEATTDENENLSRHEPSPIHTGDRRIEHRSIGLLMPLFPRPPGL